MTVALLLDEHYAEAIAVALRVAGHDVVSVVASPELPGAPDAEIFRWAAATGRRIVTENIKDFRPLLLEAIASGAPHAALLLVPPRRFPRGRGDRTAAIVTSIGAWLNGSGVEGRPVEDWLT